MIRQRNRKWSGTPQSRRWLILDTLEPRLVLSTASTTMLMDPTASGMIGQIATKHVMVIEGQTMPNSAGANACRQAHRAGPFKPLRPFPVQAA